MIKQALTIVLFDCCVLFQNHKHEPTCLQDDGTTFGSGYDEIRYDIIQLSNEYGVMVVFDEPNV